MGPLGPGWARPGPGFWEGGGPAPKGEKNYNLTRYAIITWDIIRFILTAILKRGDFSPRHV